MINLAELVDSLTKKLQIRHWQASSDHAYQLEVDSEITLALFSSRQSVYIVSSFGRLSDTLSEYSRQLELIYQLALFRAKDYQDTLVTNDEKQMELQRRLQLSGLTVDQFEMAISSQLNYADELLLLSQQTHPQKLTNINVWFP